MSATGNIINLNAQRFACFDIAAPGSDKTVVSIWCRVCGKLVDSYEAGIKYGHETRYDVSGLGHIAYNGLLTRNLKVECHGEVFDIAETTFEEELL